VPSEVTNGDWASVVKVLSLLQFVRGGSSWASLAHMRKWYVVSGRRPYIGAETGCGSSSAIATVSSAVALP
jgi:hypothetical protein